MTRPDRPELRAPDLTRIPELEGPAAAAAAGRARQDRLVADLAGMRPRINAALTPRDSEAAFRAQRIQDAAAAVLGGAAAAAAAERMPPPAIESYAALCTERELLLVAEREGGKLLEREERALEEAARDVVRPPYLKWAGWKVRLAIELGQAEAADRDYRRALAKQGVDPDHVLPNLLLGAFGDLRDEWGGGDMQQLLVDAYEAGAIDLGDLPRELHSETRSRALAARAEREAEVRAHKKP